MTSPQVQAISSKLLKPTQGSCRVVYNELVELRLGGVVFTMDHRAALELSQRLRVIGKQAKRQAGDKSREWMTAGVLTDAENDYKRGW